MLNQVVIVGRLVEKPIVEEKVTFLSTNKTKEE